MATGAPKTENSDSDDDRSLWRDDVVCTEIFLKTRRKQTVTGASKENLRKTADCMRLVRFQYLDIMLKTQKNADCMRLVRFREHVIDLLTKNVVDCMRLVWFREKVIDL